MRNQLPSCLLIKYLAILDGARKIAILFLSYGDDLACFFIFIGWL